MIQKKKMLIIAKSFGGGGVEVALSEFLNHLDTNRFDVTLLLLDKDEEYIYRLKNKVKIIYMKFDNSLYRNIASMDSVIGKFIKKSLVNKHVPLYNMVLTHTHASLLRKYDVALDFYGYGSFTTAFLAEKVNARFKATWIHDREMPWLLNVQRYLMNINSVFCVSKSVKESFCQKYPEYRGKARIFYNFVDEERINFLANKAMDFKYNSDYLNILTVGRLSKQKGIDIAIKSAYLLKLKKIKFQWYVIGAGREKSRYERLIKKYNLQNSFILLGRKDNPYSFMKKCDIYVQPSRHEGYCTTITEALVLKKMVIVSNLPENKEQVYNYKNGLTCQLDPQSLINKIIELRDNKKLQKVINYYLSHQQFNLDKQFKLLNEL